MIMEFRLFIILVSAFSIFSCNGVGEDNYDNLMKVKKGMKIKEVNSIMNNKYKSVETAFWNDSLFVQYYDSPRGASDDLGIVFNKDSLVVEIKYGD